jgi:hypothetical protein
MKSAHYERLFLLNCRLEQALDILEEFKQEKLIHPKYADDRTKALRDLRAGLSHVLTGMLHQRELEECVSLVRIQIDREDSER